jgi:hypothetical protein
VESGLSCVGTGWGTIAKILVANNIIVQLFFIKIPRSGDYQRYNAK